LHSLMDWSWVRPVAVAVKSASQSGFLSIIWDKETSFYFYKSRQNGALSKLRSISDGIGAMQYRGHWHGDRCPTRPVCSRGRSRRYQSLVGVSSRTAAILGFNPRRRKELILHKFVSRRSTPGSEKDTGGRKNFRAKAYRICAFEKD
jgi:hypothetical protein